MQQLIEQFMDRYLSRKEIIHRLPVSVPSQNFGLNFSRSAEIGQFCSLSPINGESHSGSC